MLLVGCGMGGLSILATQWLPLTLRGAGCFPACVGEDGFPVDWWIALKAPGLDRSGNTKYGYLEDTGLFNGSYVWREAAEIGAIAGNPLAGTLEPLYSSNGSNEMAYVMWNDEPGATHCPRGCTSFILGHSKGVLGFGAGGGFLLTHSFPKFPDSPADAAYGGVQPGQLLNGQSAACLSLAPDSIEEVARVLLTADLYVYSPKSLPANLSEQYVGVARLVEGSLPPWGPVDPHARSAAGETATQGGQQLRIFAKSSTGWGGDGLRMWEDVVETALAAGMLVQSWPEGRTRDLPSFCGPPDSAFESLTVAAVSLPGTSLAWPTRARRGFRDHSKWAVTSTPSGDQGGVFCMGDNNRAAHQSFRGGTATCFVGNPALHAAVRAAVAGIQPCAAGGPECQPSASA